MGKFRGCKVYGFGWREQPLLSRSELGEGIANA